jgi:hypothetical protein
VVYEIDFLPSGGRSANGTKGASAITVRFTVNGEDDDAVVVIDGGDTRTGEAIVDHVRTYYGSRPVDLVIATRTNAEGQLAGLAVVLDRLEVRELMIHQPRRHGADESTHSELDAVDELLGVARRRGTAITEPYTGAFRINGQVAILGPSQSYYERLVTDAVTSRDDAGRNSGRFLGRAFKRLHVDGIAERDQPTIGDERSVVTLIQVGEHRLLFTGDAGAGALEEALDFYESWYGEFDAMPLRFFQAPHHGNPKVLGPATLDRMFGPTRAPHGDGCAVFISSAGGDTGQASSKLVNALNRRGCAVSATDGRAACHAFDAPPRPEWLQLPSARKSRGGSATQPQSG